MPTSDIQDGRRAIYTAALCVLDRTRRTPRRGIELRYHVWVEYVRIAAQAPTLDVIRDAQRAYEHICADHLYPPTDTFYPGDIEYTYSMIAEEMRGHV